MLSFRMRDKTQMVYTANALGKNCLHYDHTHQSSIIKASTVSIRETSPGEHRAPWDSSTTIIRALRVHFKKRFCKLIEIHGKYFNRIASIFFKNSHKARREVIFPWHFLLSSQGLCPHVYTLQSSLPHHLTHRVSRKNRASCANAQSNATHHLLPDPFYSDFSRDLKRMGCKKIAVS